MARKQVGKNRQDRPVVDIPHPSYQPSVAELREDMRVNATFDQAIEALARPVTINYTNRPKKGG